MKLTYLVDIPGRLVPGTPTPGTPVPGTPRGQAPSSSSAPLDPRCSVPGCNLPGGHRLPHVDAGGNKFMYDKRTEAMIPIEASDAETSVVADSTDSEMLPDEEYREPEQKGRKDRKRREPAAPEDMTGYMFEINMTDRDWQQLAGKPRQSTAWMSKKLLEKGREVNWKTLTHEQKMSFDEAQSKEISNVIRNAAVRSLITYEKENLVGLE